MAFRVSTKRICIASRTSHIPPIRFHNFIRNASAMAVPVSSHTEKLSQDISVRASSMILLLN